MYLETYFIFHNKFISLLALFWLTLFNWLCILWFSFSCKWQISKRLTHIFHSIIHFPGLFCPGQGYLHMKMWLAFEQFCLLSLPVWCKRTLVGLGFNIFGKWIYLSTYTELMYLGFFRGLFSASVLLNSPIKCLCRAGGDGTRVAWFWSKFHLVAVWICSF